MRTGDIGRHTPSFSGRGRNWIDVICTYVFPGQPLTQTLSKGILNECASDGNAGDRAHRAEQVLAVTIAWNSCAALELIAISIVVMPGPT